MLQVVLGLAVACGVVSAATGNRTAWALLASVGLCFALDYAQVPFSFVLWMMIDLAVVLVIIRPAMNDADCIVVALFVPAWAGYMLPDNQRFLICLSVVAAQLLLTYRHRPTVALFKRTRARLLRLFSGSIGNPRMGFAYA